MRITFEVESVDVVGVLRVPLGARASQGFLVIGNRIRFAVNGTMVFDFTDAAENLQASPIGLQLHANGKPQEYRFRGLVVSEQPEDRMLTADEQ